MAAQPHPELFGDFLLVQRIAKSTMAEVLLAVRLGDRSGRTFVVKRPILGERASGRAAQAIAREGEVLAAVRARGLVCLEAAGDIAGLPYVALEHIRGVALDLLLARVGALPTEGARAVALDLARALGALHAAGWVHGDVAPSNVIIDDSGEARLIDLGLATRAGSKHVEIAGKPGYIAPEAVRLVEARPAEDVVGWGAVVAECALGRRVFLEESLAEAGARGDSPAANAALEQLAPGLSASLKRDPSARPSAEALARALDPLASDRGALADLVARAAEIQDAPPAAADEIPANAQASGGHAALTPTAPMQLSPTLIDAPAEALGRAAAPRLRLGETRPISAASGADTPASGAPARAASAHSLPAPVPGASEARWRRLAISLLVFIALVAGALAGRLSARARQSSVSLLGALPRRTQIDLDGRSAPRAAEGPIEVSPGRHVLTVTLPKGDKREYTFVVRPGEHVVLLPLNRSQGGGGDPEDRSP